jgi:hypothetical protein
MSGESARSLRRAVVSVGALGALALSVPASLWLPPGRLFPTLQPVAQVVAAQLLDDHGHPLDSPARLRPGSGATVVVTGFAPNEQVLLRGSESARAQAGGQADPHGIFRYRLTVPASMSGPHQLTVIGAGRPAGGQRTTVFHYVVSSDQAGR